MYSIPKNSIVLIIYMYIIYLLNIVVLIDSKYEIAI